MPVRPTKLSDFSREDLRKILAEYFGHSSQTTDEAPRMRLPNLDGEPTLLEVMAVLDKFEYAQGNGLDTITFSDSRISPKSAQAAAEVVLELFGENWSYQHRIKDDEFIVHKFALVS